jgi:predicted nucleic acid-binding protein
MRQLTARDWATSRGAAADLANEWSLIQPSDALRTKASELVDHYQLRAADALQLAAALEWCNDVPRGEAFLTADERLRDAALLTGFDGLRIDE